MTCSVYLKIYLVSHLGVVCRLTRWIGESNEGMCKRCGTRTSGNGMKCGVVARVKTNTMRWFGNIKRMKSKGFVEKKRVFKEVCGVQTGEVRHLEHGGTGQCST